MKLDLNKFDIIITKKNAAYIKVSAVDFSIYMELSEHFSFFVPGYKFTPAYKKGKWDGIIRLFNFKTHNIYRGLLKEIKNFAFNRGYTIFVSPDVLYNKEKLNLEDLNKFIKNLRLSANNKKISVRDYQYTSIVECLQNKQKIILSPTASGKSLIIYIIIRYLLEYKLLDQNKKIVIVVPTTALCEQIYTDFEDYSRYDDTFNVNDYFQVLYTGKEKNIKTIGLITTWQSFYKMTTLFENVGCVIGDECHRFTAKSLANIMEGCINAYYRFGLSGTLDGTKCNEMLLKGLFGPIKKVITTGNLMKQGYISKLDIDVLILKYPKETAKLYKKLIYKDEIKSLIIENGRNNFIKNLALNIKGNTMITFRYIEHGKILYNNIKEELIDTNRKIFLIYGKTDTKIREEIRNITEKEKDAILIASIGVFSTGTNIRNLNNIIFGTPVKSIINVLQSIGRVLRIPDNTNKPAKLYDIVDNLQYYKSKKNFAFKHGIERTKIYIKEGFKVNTIRINL